jgi:hypothetical protein
MAICLTRLENRRIYLAYLEDEKRGRVSRNLINISIKEDKPERNTRSKSSKKSNRKAVQPQDGKEAKSSPLSLLDFLSLSYSFASGFISWLFNFESKKYTVTAVIIIMAIDLSFGRRR